MCQIPEEISEVLTHIKDVVAGLRTKVANLTEENALLKTELEKTRAELGAKLCKERGGSVSDLVDSVEQLRDTISKKTATKKPANATTIQLVVNEEDSKIGGAQKVAQELLQFGDEPLTTAKSDEL